MSFESALHHLAEEGVHHGLEAFASDLDAEWVREALERFGAASIRRRKLPAESVVWLVVGMGLLRDCSIADVVRHLDLALPSADGSRGRVANSAVTAARQRLGEGPLEEIFVQSARYWAHEHARSDSWRGLAVYAMDGTTLNVPDTDANRAAFHLPKTGRGQSSYPKVRLVTLMAARSHLLVDAAIGAFDGKGTSEPAMARPFWSAVPDRSLLLADRNFIDHTQLHRFATDGAERHWLVRTKKNLVATPSRELAPGDTLATIEIGRHRRAKDPGLPRTMDVRLIDYEFDGKPGRLMTNLLDAEAWPAAEVIAMYHERWEIEIAFDELKTHMLERKECLRSKSPTGVKQEIWALLLAYNLVRRRMAVAARNIDQQGRNMSFVFSLRLVRAFLVATAWDGSAANIPRHLKRLDEELESATLPARRSHRRYARHVKRKMSGYKRNPGRPVTTQDDEKDSVK